MSAHNINRTAKVQGYLCPGAISIGLCAAAAASGALTPQLQQAVHFAILSCAAILMTGYSLPLKASRDRTTSKFRHLSNAASPPSAGSSESHVHECCLTGMHRL